MTNLTDYKLLSFDVYGTLIDWEAGCVDALQPVLKKSDKANIDRKTIISTCHEVQIEQQKETPGLIYSELLTKIHPAVVQKLGCPPPTEEESKAFGSSVGSWPAFPDTVDALKRLKKHYKLVVLSNVDNVSFRGSNAGPLEGFEFDAIFTAQDIGTYKPNPKNFEYLFREVKSRFGIEKEQILHTAQSQFHDHHPAKKQFGMKTSWIARYGAALGNEVEEVYDWKFATLGEMADAVEKELA